MTTKQKKPKGTSSKKHRNQTSATDLYHTQNGKAIIGNAEDILPTLDANSVDLVITSPPFALLREKAYGNVQQSEYVDWLVSFGPLVHRILKDTGSFVLDLGGSYQRGVPVRSLCNFRVLLRLCDECDFHLAEEFFWHNPSKLPSPIEWVNKRKIRAKDSVNTIWWLSKTPEPKADVSNVLAPYSSRMKKLLADPEKFYQAKSRPSGHDISQRFATDNGGAIPSNLLQFSNTESNSLYLRLCRMVNIRPHPARFPEAIPDFFIRFLTDPNDVVVDIFAGSNTTGQAAERLKRQWVSMDCEAEYLTTSAFRFMEGWSEDAVQKFLKQAQQRKRLPIPIE